MSIEYKSTRQLSAAFDYLLCRLSGKANNQTALGVSRQIHATTYVETSSRSCPRSAREAFEVSALAALGKLNKNHILRTPLSTMSSRGKYKNKDVLKDDLRDRTRNCVLM
ncbi:RNase H domain-containing protein [Caerostris extrusa]|uniref:RNase H domain-containing protein n=1 Tax=Caerostris extrusa TaxID=172846 RepID=A0AAV4Q9R3_CAEEX|nr:RNase H domain-containing protein [Caerostris extrusa]